MAKKIIKLTTKILLVLLVILIVVVGGYVGYVSAQYYRLDDQLVLDVSNNNANTIDVNNEYMIVTYNVGFGAYDHDFSFFMDSGQMLSGEKVSGTQAKATNKEVAEANTNGSIALVKAINPDFLFLQEVDITANRSHFIDQYALFRQELATSATTMALNFHSAYLFYPLNDPIGKTVSGISTFSSYQISESTRYQLPIDNSFPNRFFDLDRCILVTKIKTNTTKDLVLINVHLSAYDEGGIIRALQLEVLKDLMIEEKDNFVIVGGDFNHDIADSMNLFPTMQEVPNWVFDFPKEALPEGYTIASATNVGTCRSTDMAYTEGVNYSVVIDGFIVNNLISVTSITNVDNDFLYSDHNPVQMVFGLVG
ncbi:MAG: endonuclease/exonuclease/phosphatase family protein [Bacilli bacterium]